MPTRDEIERQLASEAWRQRDADLALFMSVPWGRRLARWLVYGLGRLEVSSFYPKIKEGGTSEVFTQRHEGRRDMAIELLADLERVDLSGVTEMRIENSHAVQAERARLLDSADLSTRRDP